MPYKVANLTFPGPGVHAFAQYVDEEMVLPYATTSTSATINKGGGVTLYYVLCGSVYQTLGSMYTQLLRYINYNTIHIHTPNLKIVYTNELEICAHCFLFERTILMNINSIKSCPVINGQLFSRPLSICYLITIYSNLLFVICYNTLRSF